MNRREFQALAFFAAPRKPKARDLYLEVAQKEGAAPALGLRYTVFREAAGKWVEAAPDRLRTGDKVRLLVEANTAGKLFVLARTNAGKWEAAAPDFPVDVAPDRAYTLPPAGTWVLDPPAGVETLCLILWRAGDASLRELIKAAEPEPLLAAALVKSRDLVFEAGGVANKETHYVVNTQRDETAKVVVEVRLRHR
jgi:hypothetical protein